MEKPELGFSGKALSILNKYDNIEIPYIENSTLFIYL